MNPEILKSYQDAITHLSNFNSSYCTAILAWFVSAILIRNKAFDANQRFSCSTMWEFAVTIHLEKGFEIMY